MHMTSTLNAFYYQICDFILPVVMTSHVYYSVYTKTVDKYTGRAVGISQNNEVVPEFNSC